jgi:hypothetical protein
MQTKICKDCNIEKSLSCFYKKSGRIDQWNPYCKECHLVRCNKARSINPNTEERRAKNWNSWYRNNKQAKIKYNSDYVKKRIKKDSTFKMRMYVGTRIRTALNKVGATKNDSVWKYLPYTPEQLKLHLEQQFEDWMNWDNYGCGPNTWNIDHIIPQSHLRFETLEEPNFLKCWCLENLRPLSSIENTKKSNKIT